MSLFQLFQKKPKSLYDLDFRVEPVGVMQEHCHMPDDHSEELPSFQVITLFNGQIYNAMSFACKAPGCKEEAITTTMSLAAKLLKEGNLRVLNPALV